MAVQFPPSLLRSDAIATTAMRDVVRPRATARALDVFDVKPHTPYIQETRPPEWKGATYPWVNGQLDPKLVPDTLYSWMSLSNALEALPLQDAFATSLARTMHFWRTPAGSHGYGDVAVRGKLRDDVNFVQVPMTSRGLNSLPTYGDVNNTVFVCGVPERGFHEYLVGSRNVFQSMSVGTPENLAEVRSEADVIRNATSSDEFDLAFKRGRTYEATPENLRSGRLTFDQKDWTLSALDRKTAMLESFIERAEGNRLYYAPGVPPDRAAHFATASHPYWEQPRVSDAE